MRRLFLILSVFALIAPACAGSTVSGDDTPASTTPSSTASEGSTDPTSSTSPGDGDSAVEEAKPAPEGPAAPDFTLALEPNGEFVLSQEVKPVYMVFWAEW